MTDAPKEVAIKLTTGYETNWYGVVADPTDEAPSTTIYTRTDIAEAAERAAYQRGLEDAAAWVEGAILCRSCHKVFWGEHTDEDCPEGYASWDMPTRPDLAAAIRACVNRGE